MKTLTAFMILVISLSFSGCATTESGAGAPSGGYTESAPKGGKMLTKKDYDRMGIKETGNPSK